MTEDLQHDEVICALNAVQGVDGRHGDVQCVRNARSVALDVLRQHGIHIVQRGVIGQDADADACVYAPLDGGDVDISMVGDATT